MTVLSICTGMGLMDRAFMDVGHKVIAGCEIDAEKRAMYRNLCGELPLTEDLAMLPETLACMNMMRFTGIIGGPSCQARGILIMTKKTPTIRLNRRERLIIEEFDDATQDYALAMEYGFGPSVKQAVERYKKAKAELEAHICRLQMKIANLSG